MLNLSVIPDFLAIGGLVAVFGSLARRTRQARLGYWLLGWSLILAHIVAQLVQRNLAGGPLSAAALALSLSTLLLASVAYCWAGMDTHRSWSRDLLLMTLAGAPDVLFFGLACFDVTDTAAYLACTAAGALVNAWLFSGGRRHADRRGAVGRGGLVLGAYAVLALLVAFVSLDAAVTWMLFWRYLAVAACFQRNAPRSSPGVVFTTASFIAWAAVFPLSFLLGDWLRAAGIENEAWNLPKFLVATGMIFVLLEGEIRQARHASLHDALTGLPNRRVFSSRLAAALRRAHEMSGRVGVLIIDLNDFKRINDTAGHAAGDALLRSVARRMQQALREGDTVARLGGDEFAAILPALPDRAGAEQLAGRLARALEEAQVEFQGESLAIGASIGMAVFPDDGPDESRLYAAADRAMYASKRSRTEAQDSAVAPLR